MMPMPIIAGTKNMPAIPGMSLALLSHGNLLDFYSN